MLGGMVEAASKSAITFNYNTDFFAQNINGTSRWFTKYCIKWYGQNPTIRDIKVFCMGGSKALTVLYGKYRTVVN